MKHKERNKKKSQENNEMILKKVDLSMQSEQYDHYIQSSKNPNTLQSRMSSHLEPNSRKQGNKLKFLSGKRFKHCIRYNKSSNNSVYQQQKSAQKVNLQKIDKNSHIPKKSQDYEASMKFYDTQYFRVKQFNIEDPRNKKYHTINQKQNEKSQQIVVSISEKNEVVPSLNEVQQNLNKSNNTKEERKRCYLQDQSIQHKQKIKQKDQIVNIRPSQIQLGTHMPENMSQRQKIRPKSSYEMHPSYAFSVNSSRSKARPLTSKNRHNRPKSSLQKHSQQIHSNDKINPYTNQQYLYFRKKHKQKIKKAVEQIKKKQIMSNILKPCQIFQKQLNKRQQSAKQRNLETDNNKIIWVIDGISRITRKKQRVSRKQQIKVDPWETQTYNNSYYHDWLIS